MVTRIRAIYEKTGFRVFSFSMIFLIGIILFSFLYSNIKGDTYNIELFQLSDETIRSSKTVEDPVKTELERQRAASELTPSYKFNDELADNQSAVISSLFGYVQDAKKLETEGEEGKEAAELQEMVAELRETTRLMETSENGLRLTDDMLRSLLTLSDERLVAVQQEIENVAENILASPVREEDLNIKRNEAEQLIRSNEEIPASVLQAAAAIVRFGVKANETVDESLTEAQLKQARESVEPTKILQGQVLVQEGQVVDREVYRQLELAGITDNQTDWKPALGLLLFVLIVMGLLLIVVQRSQEPEQKKMTALLVLAAVLIISLTLMKLLGAVSGNFDVEIAFLFPTALAGMIIRMLLNERTAILVTFITAASAGLMLQNSYSPILQMEVVLYILFGGLAGVYLIERDDRRARLLQTSLLVAIVNSLFIGFYLLISQSQYDMAEVGFYFTAAIVSGLLSGALTIGLLPFFEWAFGLLSPMRLIELSNPNHPLLKKILTETPGTYHHSVMVANLADASCEAIGANGLLARVGCYYHDIGKTKRPQYFIENQVNIANPHDSLPPETSRDIILAHGAQGAEMLRKYKMPKEIIDIADQHHGTSLLKFFYFKEKEKNPEVSEEEYRYNGPKPQTKENAVIMAADSIEAAVRSMKDPTSEKIKKLVEAIIEDKLKDGQFDECDLTMKELKTIKSVMCETLNGIFHTRIEYPKDKE
ncbi:HD family phosphohydrolase [Planococcus halotolerans]|uniref:Phosphohydrolase n=1 Tax=Planococcus halotolerans TaxID=2233542 RepID=A0A365KTY7_9BACL|nr:HD family phosphohydrolase [Planococcus halotolerans]QHJ71506.1 HDIG domain-containing protein [Planococcus halotolerans]RAZ76640.1 phosphohydrolase [Planococcus halotolerans]